MFKIKYGAHIMRILQINDTRAYAVGRVCCLYKSYLDQIHKIKFNKTNLIFIVEQSIYRVYPRVHAGTCE